MAKLTLKRGDMVMHWTYGLGKVLKMEKRELAGQKRPYYAIQVGEMTVWVPADDDLAARLRKPSTKAQLTKLKQVLSKSSVTLPQDRHERKTKLNDMLKDGKAESLCKVIRALTVFGKTHPLNDSDQALLKRAQTALVGEWGYARGMTQAEAMEDLGALLGTVAPGF